MYTVCNCIIFGGTLEGDIHEIRDIENESQTPNDAVFDESYLKPTTDNRHQSNRKASTEIVSSIQTDPEQILDSSVDDKNTSVTLCNCSALFLLSEYFVGLNAGDSSTGLEDVESGQVTIVPWKKYISIYNKYQRAKKQLMSLQNKINFYKRNYVRKLLFLITMN